MKARPARVAWREREYGFEKAPATLVVLPEGGGRVLVPVFLAEGRRVWVRISGRAQDWFRAKVRSSSLVGNQWLYHLEFREPCLTDLIATLTEPLPSMMA